MEEYPFNLYLLVINSHIHLYRKKRDVISQFKVEKEGLFTVKVFPVISFFPPQIFKKK